MGDFSDQTRVFNQKSEVKVCDMAGSISGIVVLVCTCHRVCFLRRVYQSGLLQEVQLHCNWTGNSEGLRRKLPIWLWVMH